MEIDPARREQYERICGKFIYEPEFRVKFWANPEDVLDRELGGLTEAEKYWVHGLTIGRTPQAELIDRLQSEGGEAVIEAW